MSKKSKKDNLIPDRILINKRDVETICSSYLKKEKFTTFVSVIISMLTSIILTTATAVEGIKIFKNNKIFSGIALIVIFSLVYGVLQYFKSKKSVKLLDEIYDSVIDNSDHTAIFLVSKIHEDGRGRKEIELLTEKHENRETFIIYLRLKNKWDIDDKTINKELASKLGIGEKSIRINQLPSFNYIKRTSDSGAEKLIRYQFFQTEIDINLKNNLPKKFEWMSLDHLTKDLSSQIHNHDVIKYINEHLKSSIKDSFSHFTVPTSLKVIWNITNKCGFDCQICATKSGNRRELNENEKARALLSILTLGKEKIRELDFSGGDPLWDDHSRKIIKYAISQLGQERVCVTTTGRGIEKAENQQGDLSELLYNCEITIDEGNEIPDSLRGQQEYSQKNSIQVQKNRKKVHKLIINVPILKTDMPEEDVEKLVDMISNIDVDNKEVVLLRLMKVGKMEEGYPENYNPEKFIELFQKYAQEHRITVNLQCSLRGKYQQGFCNMLEEKIGIDCTGNVFACAWGGYISCNSIEENPFYLGNVLKQDLCIILKEEKALALKTAIRRNTNQCRVFSCGYSTDGKFAIDNDPLFNCGE